MATIRGKLKSFLLLGTVWAFVGMYFIDAANLDDLLPGAIVIHPEANDSSPDGSTLGFTSDGRVPQKTQSKSHKNERTAPHTLRVIVDQDSPSLAAESLVTTLTPTDLPEDPIHVASSFTPSSSLYLLHCALLI